ncbi:DUF1499 domain-containing protein [Mesobacterium pallidum]|uniref:DUF1499 domain-containing protein n=1 Tax=Mesobacterium pallidum TaxID=2872037 RepID=UPI003AB92252
MWGFFGVLVLIMVASFALWVRIAPSDPERWHIPLTFDGNRDLEGGAMRILRGQADRLAELDAIAQATERTEALAGTVEEGRITYVTRSQLWGFPDYTTVDTSGGDLRLFARLRFGKGDMGVNKARLDGWIAALKA